MLARAAAKAAPYPSEGAVLPLTPSAGLQPCCGLAGSPSVFVEMSVEFLILYQTCISAWERSPLKPKEKAPQSCSLWVRALHRHPSPCHRTCMVVKHTAPVNAIPGKHAVHRRGHQTPMHGAVGGPRVGGRDALPSVLPGLQSHAFPASCFGLEVGAQLEKCEWQFIWPRAEHSFGGWDFRQC